MTSFPTRRHCAFVTAFPRRTGLGLIFCLIGLLAGLLVAARSEPFAAQLAVRHWQVEDGLPQNSANRVLQTHDGYIPSA